MPGPKLPSPVPRRRRGPLPRVPGLRAGSGLTLAFQPGSLLLRGLGFRRLLRGQSLLFGQLLALAWASFCTRSVFALGALHRGLHRCGDSHLQTRQRWRIGIVLSIKA